MFSHSADLMQEFNKHIMAAAVVLTSPLAAFSNHSFADVALVMVSSVVNVCSQ